MNVVVIAATALILILIERVVTIAINCPTPSTSLPSAAFTIFIGAD